MKIVKITTSVIKPVKAVTIGGHGRGAEKSLYYNVKFGSKGSDLWLYSIGVDKKLFKPKEITDYMELLDDNYILIPIKKDGKVIKDGIGNDIYFLSVDHTEDHKRDVIALWEIPNRNYTDVTYEIKGNVKVLGAGKTGRVRGDIKYVSPAPVLEIMGACELTWSAIGSDGELLSQSINYTVDGMWEINKIKVGEKDD